MVVGIASYNQNLRQYIRPIRLECREEIEALLSSTKVDFIGEILSIPAIIITIMLIQRTSNFERELLVHSETPEDSIFSDNYTPSHENAEPKI